MKHGTIAMVDGAPAIRIRDTSESKLYDIRAKSLRTGRVYRKELARIETDGRDVHIRVLGFDEGEDVIFTLTEITADELGAWFASDDEIGFRQWRQGDKVEEPSAEVTVPDVDHRQVDQDHEPETPQDGLTTLQRQIFTELNEHGAGTVAELIDRLNMPGMQAAIRKSLHILMDEKHLIGKRSRTQNGRPAQLWGVM